MPAVLRSRPIESSSGEVETDTSSRRANAIEAAGIYALVQAAMWLGIGHPPRPGDDWWARAMGLAIVGLTVPYAMIVAPWLHRDGWHGLGLPKPLEVLAVWPTLGRLARLAATALVLTLPLLLVWTGWDSVLIRLGIRQTWPDAFRRLSGSPWNQIGTAATATALAVLLAGFVVRWSNLASAARDLWRPLGVMLVLLGAAAAVVAAVSGDWIPIRDFSVYGQGSRSFVPQLVAYVPWGLLQQCLLLGYFNTRIRKAVPAAGWAGIPGRHISSGLTGLAFGAVHAPQVPLMAFTCLSGCVLGWLFQRDRSRHLFLMGLAHGLAGAIVATLTSVRMEVGP